MFLSGLWWQHETIRGVLKKDWDAYELTRPKFTVNWDRDAKRPPPPPKPKEPKPKPRPRPKPPKVSTPPMVFEDIEFKTPPLTPPPALPPAPPPANKMDDDEDFWEFYNQGVPLP